MSPDIKQTGAGVHEGRKTVAELCRCGDGGPPRKESTGSVKYQGDEALCKKQTELGTERIQSSGSSALHRMVPSNLALDSSPKRQGQCNLLLRDCTDSIIRSSKMSEKQLLFLCLVQA